MTDAERTPRQESGFEPFAQARMYGEYYEIERNETESDSDYRSRVAGELRSRGKIIEAHEVYSGRRWDDPEQGSAGPLAGITGAIAQSMQSREYSPHDPERQIGDDIAAGIVVNAGPDPAEEAIRALFGVLGPEAGMDVLDAFTRKPSQSR